MRQGELFGRPEPRRVRAWTELDRVRRRLGRLERRQEEGSVTTQEIEEIPRLRALLRSREAEARAKWKNSFKS